MFLNFNVYNFYISQFLAIPTADVYLIFCTHDVLLLSYRNFFFNVDKMCKLLQADKVTGNVLKKCCFYRQNVL